MDVGDILSKIPPIIENIFKYVSKRDLDSCAQVCDLWKRIAEIEKSRREDIAIFFQALPCTCLDSIHSTLRQPCALEATYDLESDLHEKLKDLKIKPKFCITFVSNYLVDEFEQFFPSFGYPPSDEVKILRQENFHQKEAHIKAVIQKVIGPYLLEKCPTTFCVAPGIIGCDKDLLPLEVEEGYGISGIAFPFIPGLRIFNFPIDEEHSDISKLIPEDTDIKCLLVFRAGSETFWYGKIVESCLLKQNSKLAFGGAHVASCGSAAGYVIAFCGQSVEAASIIIQLRDSVEELENKLMLFRETGLVKDRCFAFMFACLVRVYIHNERNLESSIFHKLYPEIPLIGVFGSGGIGINYLPNTVSRPPKKKLHFDRFASFKKEYDHHNTTTFVLVSLKL